MRSTGWIPAALALVIWCAACIWPSSAILLEFAGTTGSPDADVAMTPIGMLLARSIGWAGAVAILATVLGWIPGRVLGSRVGRRGFAAVALLLAIPVCLPGYVVFWSWWQAWPPGSGLHQWAVSRDIVPLMRELTLLASLTCWSWPIVSWCVAGCAQNMPAHADDLLGMTGSPWWRRLQVRFRYDSRGLLLGWLLVALITFANTISFDLATVYTFGNELRAREALGASPSQLLGTALPAISITVFAAAVLWFTLNAPRHQRVLNAQTSASRAALVTTAILWLVSLAIPGALLITNFAGMVRDNGLEPVQQFAGYYGEGVVNTLGVAFATGFTAALIALGLTMMWMDHRPMVRGLAHIQALGWLIFGSIPATIAAMSLETAYNRPGVLHTLVYSTPVVLILGQVGRFAFIGALIGRWLAMREPAELRDLRRMDQAGALLPFLKATWPRLSAATFATFGIAAVLAAGEITLTNGIRPAGFDVLAPSVLNAMHYQQVDTVLLAVLGQLLLAVLVAAALMGMLWRSNRRAKLMVVGLAILPVLLLSGCARDDDTPQPLDVEFAFGAPGQSLGQFDYPRGIAVDRANEFVYVVDKSARVQRFSVDGEPEAYWRMPAKDNGKPTGLNVAPDGRIFIADTHYYRVIAYDADGNELLRFGSYGKEPGQFIYPTDIEFGPKGELYVSEYGGNDRIQVFDAQGNYLYSFGSFGSDDGQFNRPQSMMFSADKSRLFVADACNHRIQIFSRDGKRLGGFGQLGRAPGDLSYPYDLTVLADGTLFVCEFGNHRVQHFTAEGRSIGIYGRLGAGAGELRYPWGIDTDGENAFVLDSGNNRVQVMELP